VREEKRREVHEFDLDVRNMLGIDISSRGPCDAIVPFVFVGKSFPKGGNPTFSNASEQGRSGLNG
jgi:hypothetical protein